MDTSNGGIYKLSKMLKLMKLSISQLSHLPPSSFKTKMHILPILSALYPVRHIGSSTMQKGDYGN